MTVVVKISIDVNVLHLSLASGSYFFFFLDLFIRFRIVFNEDGLFLVYNFPVALHIVDDLLRQNFLLKFLHWLECSTLFSSLLLSFLVGFSGRLLFSNLFLSLLFHFLDLSLFTLFLGLVDFSSWDELSHELVGSCSLEIGHLQGAWLILFAFENVAILVELNDLSRFLTALRRVQARILAGLRPWRLITISILSIFNTLSSLFVHFLVLEGLLLLLFVDFHLTGLRRISFFECHLHGILKRYVLFIIVLTFALLIVILVNVDLVIIQNVILLVIGKLTGRLLVEISKFARQFMVLQDFIVLLGLLGRVRITAIVNFVFSPREFIFGAALTEVLLGVLSHLLDILFHHLFKQLSIHFAQIWV